MASTSLSTSRPHRAKKRPAKLFDQAGDQDVIQDVIDILDQEPEEVTETEHAEVTLSLTPRDRVKKLFVKLSDNFGYACTLDHAMEVKLQFETTTFSRFVMLTSNGTFGKGRDTRSGVSKTVYWNTVNNPRSKRIPEEGCLTFDGIPYLHVGSKVYQCHHGSYGPTKRTKHGAKQMASDAHGNPVKKSRKITVPSKKLGCPAHLIIREVIKFPEFKISENTESRRKTASIKLRKLLEGANPPQGQKRFYIYLPTEKDHAGTHVTNQVDGASQRLDKRVIDKIYEIMSTYRVCSISEMELVIKHYVRDDLHIKCSEDNRRFFPKRLDIRYHMNMARKSLGVHADDPAEEPANDQDIMERLMAQRTLEKLILDWKAEEDQDSQTVYFRKYVKGSSMKAAQFDAPGAPSVLYVGDVPVPELNPREILLQIKVSAINRADTLQRKGGYNPPAGASKILGLEAAGIVHKIGPECKSSWAVGDKVMALLTGGGNAEYATVHEDHLMSIGNLSMEQAAAIPEVWLTAYQLLFFVGHMKSNNSVLIHAGGSGVGTAATQLVKQAGGHPIVTAGSVSKIVKAVSLGAEVGFNYREGNFAEGVLKHTNGKGVDMILDCVGGSHAAANLQAIAMDGQWVLYGLLGGVNVPDAFLLKILQKRVTLSGTTLRARSDEYKAELIKDFTEKALPLFESEDEAVKLKPVIDRIFPLNKIAEAHQYMEDNKTMGKVLIRIDGTEGHGEL